MILAIKYSFPSTASWLNGTIKTKKANGQKGKWLDEFLLQSNTTKLEQTDKRKTALALHYRHYIMFPKGIGPIFVKIVA